MITMRLYRIMENVNNSFGYVLLVTMLDNCELRTFSLAGKHSLTNNKFRVFSEMQASVRPPHNHKPLTNV